MPKSWDAQTKFAEHSKAVIAVSDLARKVFGNGWGEESAWQWLAYLKDDIGQYNFESAESDIEVAYFISIVSLLHVDLLLDIAERLRKIDRLLISETTVSVAKIGGQQFNKQLIMNLFKECGLTDAGASDMITKLVKVSQTISPAIEQEFREFVSVYKKFNQSLEPVAAGLLYYRPENTPVLFTEFKEVVGKTGIILDNSTVTFRLIRYLGQSFYGRDTELRLEAQRFLSDWFNNKKRLENLSERVVFVILLYVMHTDFYYQTPEKQSDLVANYLSWAIWAGVPMRSMLINTLADSLSVVDYTGRCGAFARKLENSDARIWFDGESASRVSEFFAGFNNFSKDGVDLKTQESYVNLQLDKYKLGAGYKDSLAELLYLYVNLRDCRIVDYRGLLSEGGAVDMKYNWKDLVEQDLSANLRNDLRKFFKMLHRPLKIKMQLIIFFESIAWRNEPFLSRVLVLSDIYEEVYGNFFGPLVYFDQEKSEFVLNKELPKFQYT